MILQVVGFKDVGKTTLMEKLVAYVKRLGYAVVTIKHHGHAGEDIKLPADHLDHMRHFNAGADQSIVQGHRYIESVQSADEMPLRTLIDECVTIEKSIIFVEGYKHEHYDKVIVYRNEAEYAQLQQLSNVKFAIKRDATTSDEHALFAWLTEWIEMNEG
ncbi:molybdopterin-guanine dinucleotide biosynthesis protein B [Staphylococcus pseudintermedius]|uniref:molybdopterin-guanine dinucleotide biosynthesis protein B n=1 Tax=Staphylococcus pseudintermedius TaxID=283734 RepID=UPI000C710A1C|nr:molybdopterin-guanine dinucleotide biosynthesis protein B [Staphylococcus pseudintermedius]EJE4551299.1 molybdopterin-guanine dinucleotide biosynthesis protein B [Staphylococcus pseudintermedius]MCE5646788.1 molybdopterin-guanine dinucleotide biosynthesis protein B [Staphylococcus pseudintermedius]MCE5667372.1 molybdopterin-guanine dinucleotide biosynthesis protein B [Staphylococcus pseudintermedius]PPD64892.1 molybdopterin-guanine dinucleotide biosynthesis protein B [Staphylococcus pseudint